MKALQIIIPLYDDYYPEGDIGAELTSNVLSVLERHGETMREVYGERSVFSGDKSVGVVDIDKEMQVIPKAKKGKAKKA